MSIQRKIAVMIADGTEPVEVIAPLDAWSRGNVETVTISTMGRRDLVLDRNIKIQTDALIEDVDFGDFDGILVPGGALGVENLSKSTKLADALRRFMGEGRFVFSICAGPTILANLGLLEGRRATCYPGLQAGWPAGVYPNKSGIVHDGNLVTASGPAFALDFALVCLAVMTTQPNANEVASGMLANLTS